MREGSVNSRTKQLIYVKNTLTIARTRRSEFQSAEMEFVLTEDWDDDDGEFDASKVVHEYVHVEKRKRF